MAAILHVTAHIGQIHQQRRHPVPDCPVHIADLCGDDRLDARATIGRLADDLPGPAASIVSGQSAAIEQGKVNEDL
jgi:hypothetical protein